MTSARFVHGGDIYVKRPNGGVWLDFSANINPLGLPESVRQTLLHSFGQVIHYPDPHARELKNALAEYYRVPQNSLLLGNGAAELFYLFFRLRPFKRALIPAPTFSEYERATRAAGTEVRYARLDPEHDFSWDGEAFWAAGREVDAFVLANPNNPTGNLLPDRGLRDFLSQAMEGGKWVLIDESFLDFLPDEAKISVRDLAVIWPKLVVVRSLTKFFALPGLRLGFAVANPETVRQAEALKDVWNVNLLAQKAGVAALHDSLYREQSLDVLTRERDFLVTGLAALPGWRVYPPVANFILADVGKTQKAASLWRNALQKRGILIRTFEDCPGLNDNYVRLAVRTRTENEQLLKNLQELQGGSVGAEK